MYHSSVSVFVYHKAVMTNAATIVILPWYKQWMQLSVSGNICQPHVKNLLIVKTLQHGKVALYYATS